jgi:formate/nitrite transporter FocA (FNT family)
VKIALNILLGILVFLAISSGTTKILLMQQDVEFFGAYGFTHSILIAYGVIQLFGGVLLAFPKTRIAGAIVVAITFLVSLVVLLIAGNIPVAIITLLFVGFLGLIIKQSLGSKNNKPKD